MRRHRRERSAPFGLGRAGTAFVVVLLGFLDLSTTTQMAGLASAGLAIPYVNPKSENNGDKKVAVSPVPLFARVQWKGGWPHDLDFWVQCFNLANGEKTNYVNVNYKQKAGLWLDLVKDDLGGPSYLNEEQVQSNSQVQGVPNNTSCTFNVHLYHSHGGAFPLEGSIIVIQDKDSDQEVLIADLSFLVAFPGEEMTLVSAVWDDRGNFLPEGSSVYPDVPTKSIATASPEE